MSIREKDRVLFEILKTKIILDNVSCNNDRLVQKLKLIYLKKLPKYLISAPRHPRY